MKKKIELNETVGSIPDYGARIRLHIDDTNDHAHCQIIGGQHCKTRRFFTSNTKKEK